METKKSKYDTNPLDADVARKSEEVWGADESKPETREMKGATRPVGPAGHEEIHNAQSEAPTRRYGNVPLDSPYPSVFVPPVYSPPSTYQAPSAPNRRSQTDDQKPTSRTVAGVGLPEKWAMVLPYAPFYIGVIVALIELFLVPRKEVKVRFHAAQGLALHVAILLVHTLFGVIGTITGSSVGGTLFKLAATVFLIISMVRVWKGEPNRVAPLAEPTQWFNERIEPRNKN